MTVADLIPLGAVRTSTPPAFEASALVAAAHAVRRPAFILRHPVTGTVGVALDGDALSTRELNGHPTYPLLGSLPALYPEWLGDRGFNEVHGTRFAYIAGAMANGIATTELVIAMAENGMLGFFGSAGLTRPRVEQALDTLTVRLGERLPWGMNLIHSPNEPDLEESIAELYIQRGVRRVSASAYMGLTEPIVRYACTGLRRGSDGRIERQNFVFAKISRPETARRFLMPAPQAILDALVAKGQLTREEAELAALVPVAEDITMEADSGGHTDNQTLTAVFPVIMRLRDDLTREHGYTRPIRVGAAGGLGTPSAVAAAFALGAAYVLTGSVNQGSLQGGLCDYGKQLLAQATMGDVIMAPSADMFELGVKVQVLKRGTLFGPRALKLYEIYTRHDSLESLPDSVRGPLEKQILGQPWQDVWQGTRDFFLTRNPAEVARAEREPKHKMALVFRWYLGLSSKWAIVGDEARRMDYQIWCGPAQGAFNDWVRGSFLEAPEARDAVQIALNLLEGAAVVTRAQQLRTYGVPMPAAAFDFSPRPLA
ncbi:MAG: PfaD family polyunsaturated fatty acid/polyketide biosynthesis protein [Sandaracinaceae bacterium]|nr:PfaD family polyunsaturated fatty acid/polyketide biosynthesis protein [Sandaracinaceae bacterium]